MKRKAPDEDIPVTDRIIVASKVITASEESEQPQEAHCLEVWNGYLCSGEDCTITVWNENGDTVNILTGHSAEVYCMTVWNNRLCSGSGDNSIRIWNTDMKCEKILQQHKDTVFILRVWNNFLYSCSTDDRIMRWNEKGACLDVFHVRPNSLWGLSVPNDVDCYRECRELVLCLEVWNEYLCSGCKDGIIRVWNHDADDLEGHTRSVECMTVWRNFLCSGSSDKSIRIWNTKMKCVAVLRGHESSVTNLRASNKCLFSGDMSGKILVWKWGFKKHFLVLHQHTDAVTSMRLWNNTLWSASNDGTIILWRAPVWTPSTHSIFPGSARKQVMTVLMIAAKKQDGTPFHPQSHLHTLPKDILFHVLSYAIQFW